MNCNEAVEKLWQYLDRELEGDKVVEIELHLQECRGCFSKRSSSGTSGRYCEGRVAAIRHRQSCERV